MAVPDIAQAVGAGMATLAAGASWMSVRQARLALNAGVLPDLHADVLVVGLLPGADRIQLEGHTPHVQYTIHNAGGGIAKGAAFLFVHEGQYVAGPVGVGLVRPGETYLVRTSMPASGLQEDGAGIVVCRDARETIHVRDIRAPRVERLRHNRRRPPPSLADLFRRKYPQVDLGALRQTGTEVRLS